VSFNAQGSRLIIAQGSRLIIVVVQVRPVKIYVAAVEALKRKDTMKLSLTSKLEEKLVWVPVSMPCKISIPS
jgi:hypothetical protein